MKYRLYSALQTNILTQTAAIGLCTCGAYFYASDSNRRRRYYVLESSVRPSVDVR